MAETAYPFAPDYIVPPGWVLEEYLEVRGIPPAEFAQLCGRSPELIAGIIAGEAPVDPPTAAAFERTLGLAAHIWLGMEQRYRQGLAQGKRVAELAKETAA